jgi:uncharacterized protein
VPHPKFQDEGYFLAQGGYSLLPLRFERLRDGRYFAANFVGEFQVVDRDTLTALIRHEIPMHSDLYNELKSKHFLMDEESSIAIDLLSAKYRTRLANLPEMVGLHIFVLTLRCNQSCRYCQVTRCTPEQAEYDMTPTSALLAVDFMFQGPSKCLKVEFQGGEPTLNLNTMKVVVEESQRRALAEGRNVEFVACTNLTEISDEMFEYFRENKFLISTSLDGPADLHDANRAPGLRGLHAAVTKNIERARLAVGVDRVSALMTTTRATLNRPWDVIDEYLRCGFSSIFLRPLNPYGFATRNRQSLDYSVEEWLTFFNEALDYIIEINKQGATFQEQFTSLILRKILTPFGHGYVDLQSPTGSGLKVMAYNYDGGIYASDESRMLASMGDEKFRLGTLGIDTFVDVVTSDLYFEMVSETMLEGVPMCVDCGFQSYCGSDPVRHYRSQGDLIGFKPNSDFCQKQKGMIEIILARYLESPSNRSILQTWI